MIGHDTEQSSPIHSVWQSQMPPMHVPWPEQSLKHLSPVMYLGHQRDISSGHWSPDEPSGGCPTDMRGAQPAAPSKTRGRLVVGAAVSAAPQRAWCTHDVRGLEAELLRLRRAGVKLQCSRHHRKWCVSFTPARRNSMQCAVGIVCVCWVWVREWQSRGHRTPSAPCTRPGPKHSMVPTG